MQIAAIIVAAGRGTRAGGGLAKQWRMLAGRPVLAHALEAFAGAGIAPVVLVLHPDDFARADALMAPGVLRVAGGASRDASVRAGLAALAGTGAEGVLIHDGARPAVSRALIGRLVAALATHEAAAPALPVTDALWRGAEGRVIAPHPREGLYRAQTPQAFRLGAITAAHAAHPGGAADDVEVALAAGLDVAILEGEEDNLKITHPADFARAERILGARGQAMDVRLGNGFDVHRFGPGDHVWLGGVKIAHDRALVGHSDADVAIHAICDAIYGALGAGDIGQHFPPSDPQWRGAPSRVFLAHAAALARESGWRIGNVDVSIICERPRIGPHADAMRATLAEVLGLDPSAIGIKATTSEGLGFTGREEGIVALATAALIRP